MDLSPPDERQRPPGTSASRGFGHVLAVLADIRLCSISLSRIACLT